MMILTFVATAALAAGQPVAINPALLEGLPSVEAQTTVHGEKLVCSGPRLRDIAGKIGVPHGKDLGGPMLANGLLFRSSDGYAVLFSVAELDETLGNSPAILARQCNGKPLDEKSGPFRLIVPGEARPARAARQVLTLELVVPANPPAERKGH